MATPSGKGAYYAPSHSGLAVNYGPLEACIEAAVSGKWEIGDCQRLDEDEGVGLVL